MYEAFYKLANDPFRLLPDPGICFPHRSCAKAWAYLRYALKRGEGIVVVTGPPGSGKTTLAERLLNELNPAKTVSVRLIANDLNATDLLRKLAYSFGLPAEGMDRAMLAHRIERYLIELEQSQRRALVLIDEAQTLSHHSLEAMRLLTDLQSRSRPVLQLFLLGQEELEGVMSAPGMTQFQQRVIASSRLHTMDLTETKAYLEYRLGFADWTGDPSVNGPAVMAIFRYSRGLPRHVNKICSRLLLHGCTEEKHALGEQDVLAVVRDLRDELLAPADAEQEAVPTVVGSAFESVYELALVPSAQAPAAPSSRAEKDPAPAAQLQQRAVADEPHQTRSDGQRRQSLDGASGRGFYAMGYQPRVPWGRRLRRLLRAPRALIRQMWDLVVYSAPLVWKTLIRTCRELAAAAQKGVGVVRRWAADPRLAAWSRRLGARLSAWPRVAVVGSAVLLAGILVPVLWHSIGESGPSLAGDAAIGVATEARLGEGSTAGSLGRLGLIEQNSAYLGVVVPVANAGQLQQQGLLDASLFRDPAAHGDLVLPGAEGGERGVGLLARRSGLEGELEHLALGRVAGDAADLLVGRVARAGTSLGVWALANGPRGQAPETDVLAGTAAAETVVKSSPGKEFSEGDAGVQILDSPVAHVAQPAAPSPADDAGHGTFDLDRDAKPPLPTRQIALIVSDQRNGARGYVRFLPTQESTKSPAAERAQDSLEPDVVAEGEVATPSATTPPGAQIPAVAASSVVLDDIAPAPAVAQQEEVDRLLALAESAMARDRLLRPWSGSAYSYLQRVLEIDAQNEAAHAGLDRIVDRYGDLARWSLDHEALDKAELFVERALRVRPDNAEMRALRDEIENAIVEAEAAELREAELARIAFEMRQQEMRVEEPETLENSFDSLMRFVDGEN